MFNPATLRWLDASIFKTLLELAEADGLTITQDLQYDSELAESDAILLTDDWEIIPGRQVTQVEGRLTIMVRASSNTNIYNIKTLMGKFASYVKCIRICKLGDDVVIDDGTEVGTLSPVGAFRFNLYGESLKGKIALAAGEVVCDLKGDLEGI